MSPKFGTSGVRGLVRELTPELVAEHVTAFIASCDTGTGVCVGRDLRPSSARIASDVIKAATAAGCRVIDCGEIPTPALALAALDQGAGAIMVTGSHIPADRNGIKFYSRAGEITKRDEAAISAALGAPQTSTANGALEVDTGAGTRFVSRYIEACGSRALSGMKIGHYTHSSVGRDILTAVLQGLGAEVLELGRSDTFIPVDTEAVDPDVRKMIKAWTLEHGLDALVSTDGDADRPLLADEKGNIVPGDVLGQIVAQTLGAETVVTPISSNSGVLAKSFGRVMQTRIGSPYVIHTMQEAGGRVVGYEANGGFLLGFEAEGPVGKFAPLPTRDCVLPLVIGLIATKGCPLSERVAAEPSVVTLADRLQEVPQAFSAALIRRLGESADARAAFLGVLGGEEKSLNLVDGVRISLEGGLVVHLRPSGNAPELRLYVEAETRTEAETLLSKGLSELNRQKMQWQVSNSED